MSRERFDFAVIGKSMSGKSTWVASLFSEEAALELRKVCEQNDEGQTKIPVWYVLSADESEPFAINRIEWDKEFLSGEHMEEGQRKAFGHVCRFFGIPETDGAVETLRDDRNQGQAFRREIAAADPLGCIREVVNDSEIYEAGVISHIELKGPANEDVRGILKECGQREARIRDTRGFLDETEDGLKRFLEESGDGGNGEGGEPGVEDYARRQLDERGLSDVDACVFVHSANDNAMHSRINRKIYGPLLRAMLERHPMFLVTLDSIFNKEVRAYPERPYRESCGAALRDEDFAGDERIRELIESYRPEGQPDYREAIIRKHNHRLLLPLIPKKRWEEDAGMYKKCAAGVFGEAMAGIRAYYKDMAEAERCLSEITGEHAARIRAMFDQMYDQCVYAQCEGRGSAPIYNCWTWMLFQYSEWLSKKIQGPYYGGMVGRRGGLTTSVPGGGHVGDTAIMLLKYAYEIKEEIYRSRYIDERLDGEIRRYCEATLPEGADVDAAAADMEAKIGERLQFELNRNYETLSITNGRMIERSFLSGAYYETRNELEIDENGIRKCLPEFEGLFMEGVRESLRYEVSAVKLIVWKLIEKTLIPLGKI